MNVMIGASVLLIAGSAIALVSGWVTDEEMLIWASIGASVAAAVVLTVAYVQTRRRPAASPFHVDGTTDAAPADETGPAAEEAAVSEPVQSEVAEAPRPPAARPGTRKTATKTGTKTGTKSGTKSGTKTGTKPETPSRAKAASKPAAASKPTQTRAEEVVAIPERKKFHKADCRYAQSKGAEKMSKSTARRRGYDACGICKP